MGKEISTKPYLVRAIYQWCTDSGLTPYLAVAVDDATRVPVEYVQDGEIVLNIGSDATPDLVIDNDWVSFTARFGGVARDLLVPTRAVIGIYAKENGQGLFFGREPAVPDAEVEQEDVPPAAPTGGGAQRGKPSLKIVK